jgi:hypothetical protein
VHRRSTPRDPRLRFERARACAPGPERPRDRGVATSPTPYWSAHRSPSGRCGSSSSRAGRTGAYRKAFPSATLRPVVVHVQPRQGMQAANQQGCRARETHRQGSGRAHPVVLPHRRPQGRRQEQSPGGGLPCAWALSRLSPSPPTANGGAGRRRGNPWAGPEKFRRPQKAPTPRCLHAVARRV